MSMPVAQRLGHGVRALGPVVVTAFLVLLVIVPWSVPGIDVAPPPIALMAAFYWAIHRPALLPAVALFVIGMVQGALGGEVLGVTALILLGTHAVVKAQRRFFLGKPFVVAWWGFMMVMIVAGAVDWGVAALRAGAVVDPAPVVAQAIVGVIVYPAVAALFALLQRTLPE